jgi:hypothetical protein
MSTCGTCWRMEAHCNYALCCVLVRLKTYVTGFTLQYWCYCNDFSFCTVVLSTDPGNGTDTQEFCLKQKAGRYSNTIWCTKMYNDNIYKVAILLYFLAKPIKGLLVCNKTHDNLCRSPFVISLYSRRSNTKNRVRSLTTVTRKCIHHLRKESCLHTFLNLDCVRILATAHG